MPSITLIKGVRLKRSEPFFNVHKGFQDGQITVGFLFVPHLF